MASSNMTFSDWRNNSNANLMTAAEDLLEKLEDTSDLLAEIDKKFILGNQETSGEGSEEDDHTNSVIQRFHEGVDSARDLVNMLKREKWRLSKRQMSVEMTMGELEEYKRHLKNDVSSLNQTVEALSMRMVQLENELAEAQDQREGLEAELEQHRNSLLSANDRNVQLYTENEDLKTAVKALQKSTVVKENEMLKDEVNVLTQENHKLKDMVRDAEAKCPPFTHLRPPPTPLTGSETATKDDNLARLRREFLEELTSLELSQRRAAAAAAAAAAGTQQKTDSGSVASSDSTTPAPTMRKIPIVNVQADV